MNILQTDVAIIGGGAAGLAAAIELAGAGIKVCLIEREWELGGILNQCIHNGFGLDIYREELTGPEFAARLLSELSPHIADGNCNIFPGTTVRSFSDTEGGWQLNCLSPEQGLIYLNARAVILAMGSRERNRGNVRIPGGRPAGVFTAGLAQRLVNIEGFLPGKEAVIIGSGDIGLIMARRLIWSGCKVKAVVEILSEPSGLPRNISQCLEDFNIPLYLSTQTTAIHGNDRVRAVELTPHEGGRLLTEKAFTITCDTLLFSVGLVPENELSRMAGVELSPITGGAKVDAWHMTNLPGVFSCGNVLHIHDLADNVVEEARITARHCSNFLSGLKRQEEIPLVAGKNVRYICPSGLEKTQGGSIYLRSLIRSDSGELRIHSPSKLLLRRRLSPILPAQMIQLDIKASLLSEVSGDMPLECSIEHEVSHA